MEYYAAMEEEEEDSFYNLLSEKSKMVSCVLKGREGTDRATWSPSDHRYTRNEGPRLGQAKGLCGGGWGGRWGLVQKEVLSV